MTTLVTGGSGFLGHHVLAALRGCGGHVVALGRRRPEGWPAEDFVPCDLDDAGLLWRAVASIEPDAVIHAAGKVPPAESPTLYRANTRATANLLAALERLNRPVRVVLAGSAAELGPVPSDQLPIVEGMSCRPVDAYGLSKWAATRLGLAALPPLAVCVARVFNPIGPGMPSSQAFGRFAAALAQGSGPLVLPVGDLSPRRDFVDVRDVARAFVLLLERGGAGEIYHLGAGRSRSIDEGLRELIRLSGREVRVEPCVPGLGRAGPTDSLADTRKVAARAGWRPSISFEQSVADLWSQAHATALRRVA